MIDITEELIGKWITNMSTYNGELSRKFYEVKHVENENICLKTYTPFSNKRPDDFYDMVFSCLYDSDEIFDTFEECKEAYPEEFI